MAAKGGIGGDLKIRLGLDFTNLQEGLLTAESTMKQGIAAINAQKVQIKIQTDIDMAKLQGVGSELDKLKVKENELTQLIQLQTDKYKAFQRIAAEDSKLGNIALNVKNDNNLRRVEQELERYKAQLRDINQQKIRLQVETDQNKINQAEEHLKQSITRMRTQIGNIKLQADIDASKITGADAAIQKEILSQKTLNAEIQKQELILQRLQTLQNVQTKNYGANALPTLNTQGAVLQQQQNLAALRQQAQATTEEIKRLQQEAARAAKPTVLQQYQGLKTDAAAQIGKVTGALGQLKAATTSTDAAITASIEMAGRLGGAWGAVATAIAAVPVVTFALQKELVNLAMPAITSGDAAYTLSRQMATTTGEASRFNTVCKLMGVDTQLVLGSLQRMDKQFLTAGASGNNVTKTLQAFGVSLTDADGKLKSHEQQMLALAEGFNRARKSGQQYEMQNLLIRNGMGDMVVAIEDYAANLEVFQKRLVRAGTANPVLAHAVQGEVHLMNQQAGQIGKNFANALLPVAQELVPRITKVYAELTEFISDNKDTIKLWGQVAADVLTDLGDTASSVLGVVGDLVAKFDTVRSTKVNSLVEKYVNDDSVKNLEDLMAKEVDPLANALKNSPLGHFKLSGYLLGKVDKAEMEQAMAEIKRARDKLAGKSEKSTAPKVEIFDERREQADKDRESLTKETEKILTDIAGKGRDERIKILQDEVTKKLQTAKTDSKRTEITAQNEAEITALLQEETSQRIAAIQKEAEEKRKAVMPATVTEHGETIKPNEWQQQALTAIDANAAAKIQQIESEMAAKRKSIIDGITSAEKQAADARAQFNEQVAAQIDGVWRSSLANRLQAIEKEKRAWIQKGLDEVKATKWAETQKSQAAQQAAQEMFTSQRKYLEIYRKAIKQGRGIEGASEAIAAKMREEKGIKKTDRTTAGELMGFQQAMQNAQNSLVPILADSTYQGTYKGTKQALVEIIRGTDLTHESPQGAGYMANMQSGIVQATANMLNGVTTSQTQLAGSMTYLGDALTAASDKLYGGMTNLQGAQETAAQNMVEMIRGTEMTLEQPQDLYAGTDSQGRKWSDYQDASHEYVTAGMMKNGLTFVPAQGWLTQEQFMHQTAGIGQVAYDMSALKPMMAALTRDENGNLRLNDTYREQAGITTNQQELQVLEAIKGALEQNVQAWQAVDQARDERMAVINPRTGQPVGAGLPPQREYNPRDYGAGGREGNSFNNTFNFELSGSLQDFYEPVTQEAAARLADQLESSMSALATSY